MVGGISDNAQAVLAPVGESLTFIDFGDSNTFVARYLFSAFKTAYPNLSSGCSLRLLTFVPTTIPIDELCIINDRVLKSTKILQ
mmetsp:Transcript_17168/g.37248  ORF Transcript_17168/g.37248 Transcript_17168/m.37248 type:complete len:84 (-) Transcript_17168:604-855(-)